MLSLSPVLSKATSTRSDSINSWFSVFDKGIDIVPGCPVGILCIKRGNAFIQRVKHASDILLNVFTLQLGKLVIITNREIT